MVANQYCSLKYCTDTVKWVTKTVVFKILKSLNIIIASAGILWRTFAEWCGEDRFLDVYCLVQNNVLTILKIYITEAVLVVIIIYLHWVVVTTGGGCVLRLLVFELLTS
jgi:hypothetical protein